MTLGMEMMSFKKRHTDSINKFGHSLCGTARRRHCIQEVYALFDAARRTSLMMEGVYALFDAARRTSLTMEGVYALFDAARRTSLTMEGVYALWLAASNQYISTPF